MIVFSGVSGSTDWCTDDLSVLVRELSQVGYYRGRPGSLRFTWTGCSSIRWFSEVGVEHPLDHAGWSECRFTGHLVHISLEEVQSWRQREKGKRVSVDDHRSDAGEQM